jgi:hypothetical protein
MLYLSIRDVNEPILSGIGCLGLACLFWYQARARHEPEYFFGSTSNSIQYYIGSTPSSTRQHCLTLKQG